VNLVKKKCFLIVLVVFLTACGGNEEDNSSAIGSEVPLFDQEWFSFNYEMANTNVVIYKDSIKKNNEQLLQYTATKVVGELPSSELLNAGVDNSVYNPYANLYDVLTLTEKRLLYTPQQFLPNTPRPKNIVFNDAANMFSTVPYNAQMYKDTAITTIKYVTQDLSGTLVTEAINESVITSYEAKLTELRTLKIAVESELARLKSYSLTLQTGNSTDFLLNMKVQESIKVYQGGLQELENNIANDTTNLTKLKSSKLTFDKGAIAVQQTVLTTYEDSVTFTLVNSIAVNSISDWKASYAANIIFRDYQWSGHTFSCVVNLNNIPTGDCALNYQNNIYRANYAHKAVVSKPSYILFNKIAADALEALIKQSFTVNTP